MRSPGEKRAEQGNKHESLQCNGSSYATVWVQNLDSTETAQEQIAGDRDEVLESGGSDEARQS